MKQAHHGAHTLNYSADSEKRKSKIANIVAHLCALGVAGFFLYAASSKIGPINARQFAVQISNYKILDEAYVNIPAIVLPWIEVFAAIALIIPMTRKAGAILIGGMLLFFIGAIYYAAIHLGLSISCGCTGKGSGSAGWLSIAENVGMLVATILSVILYRRK